jgi:hypothetical protein
MKKIAIYFLLTVACPNISITNNSSIAHHHTNAPLTLDDKEHLISQNEISPSYQNIVRTNFLKAKYWTAGTALTFGAAFFSGFIAAKAHISPSIYYFSSSYLTALPTIIFSATALSALVASGYVFYQGYKLLSNEAGEAHTLDFNKIFTCVLVAGGIITGMGIGALR